jgi:predicted nucleic acid-binding protein
LSAFVDSSAFYAAADDADRSSVRARELLSSEERLFTTDHVLVESWLLLQRRLGASAAERFWAAIRAGATSVSYISAADLEAAWAIGERFPDQSFSIVDRTSFAVMERLGVYRAIAFDDDFAVYRFGSRRSRAFEVLR